MFSFPKFHVPSRIFRLSLGFALAGASLFGAADAQAAKKAKCDATSGWSAFAGRPATFTAGAATGLYVWQERTAWRFGVTNDRGAPTTFSVQVTLDANVSGKPVGAEGKSDILEVQAKQVKFRFANFGGLDGVAIESPCATSITIQGEINGQPLTSSQVFLGVGGGNPVAMPAVLSRGVPVSKAAAVAAAPTTASAMVVAPTAVSTTVAPPCPSMPWPVSVLGRPPVKKGPSGMYAWIQGNALKIALEADPGAPRLFEGKITANAAVTLKGVGADRKDQVLVAGQQVSFALKVGKASEVFDVVSPCATSFMIEALIDGVAISPAQVFVGAGAANPVAVPAVLARP
jgi:hypothetical protein